MVRRIFTLLPLLTSLLFFLIASSCEPNKKTYRIGIDPNWYPLDVMGKETNIFAFTNNLLKEISRLEGINFEPINTNWDYLLLGLKEKAFEGILSSIHPYLYRLSTYNFSKILLHTGPVLIIRSGSSLRSMEQLKGKEIAVDSQENETLLIQHYPQVIVRYYALIPEGLNDIFLETIDGALVNHIPAMAFVQGLYAGKVKIASPPLNDAGVRMVTLHGENQELIMHFNRGLEKVHKKGIYNKLLKKWNLAKGKPSLPLIGTLPLTPTKGPSPSVHTQVKTK